MTDVTVGSSAVLTTGAPIIGIAGEAITINQAVYLDQTVSPPVWKKTDADALATAGAMGIALNTAPSGGILAVAGPGARVTMSGASLTVATPYFVSTGAGGICPFGDLSTGDYPCFLGFAVSTTALDLVCKSAGVAL